MPAREILSWHGWHALDSGGYAMGGKAKKAGDQKVARCIRTRNSQNWMFNDLMSGRHCASSAAT